MSLRFKFLETSSSYEAAESVADKLTFDTVGEIQDALGDLFEDGKAPFDLQEQILELEAIRAEGAYTQADMTNQLSTFQNNLSVLLSSQGKTSEVNQFMDALQEFMSARAIDLSEFRDATGKLTSEVSQYAERITAGADARMEMSKLADLVTAEGLSRDAKLTESGKRTADQPVMTVASTVAELPVKLDQVIASLDEEAAERFGASAMAGFNSDQFA